ncbi:MAG: chromosomal replication initiator protein DnaA [Xanthobacteraceae bacterium]|nr:chromosomal replication initiator protein DnaA [Xanthobacteraceae bacterium]
MTPLSSGRELSVFADGPASSSPATECPPSHRRNDSNEKKAMPDVSDECWARVKKRLQAELGDAIYTSWFARMELESLDHDTARITVPTRFLKSWILSHYSERLLACWQSERPGVRRIDLAVRSAAIRSALACAVAPPEGASAERREPHLPKIELKTTAAAPARLDGHGGSPLDPRLTFDSFVIGRSNTLAHAAAKQVAMGRRNDPVMFNPLFVHAGVGLGKTHLLQAIAIKTNASGERAALYLTAERFMFGFASALRSQTALAFKDALRGIDVLVIDDLQFLQGKNSQAEFSHTLNSLLDGGRQVVVAADRPPTELESLDDRMRSRLAGGLAVEIGAFDEELRLEILTARVRAARAHHPGFTVPEPVLSYISRSVTHNGRDLEGALNRLLANSKLSGQPITMELAERELRDLIRPLELKRVRIEDIQRIVARHYNVSRSDLLSSRRTANVVRPRQIAMYLAKTLTLRSLPEIGRRFGGRDHTTVLHAVRKIESLIGADNALATEIESLKSQLQE